MTDLTHLSVWHWRVIGLMKAVVWITCMSSVLNRLDQCPNYVQTSSLYIHHYLADSDKFQILFWAIDGGWSVNDPDHKWEHIYWEIYCLMPKYDNSLVFCVCGLVPLKCEQVKTETRAVQLKMVTIVKSRNCHVGKLSDSCHMIEI